MNSLNKTLVRCPECGYSSDISDPSLFRGCPKCLLLGMSVNMAVELPLDVVERGILLGLSSKTNFSGIKKWSEALPVGGGSVMTLGEGNTPIVELQELAAKWGVNRVAAKIESVNPTWSHKDRLAATTVSLAAKLGESRVLAASTGNHGAALAAYCAKAGLDCIVYTVPDAPQLMLDFMRSYGAQTIQATSHEERYTLLASDVESNGGLVGTNAVFPPIGSHPVGVAAYKSIAYEVFSQYGREIPSVMVIPVAYGDCLAGVYEGFKELEQLELIDYIPRLVGVDSQGSLALSFKLGDIAAVKVRHSVALSLTTAQATHQSLLAIRASGGVAVTVSDAELVSAREMIAHSNGLLMEFSSASVFAALERLRDSIGLKPDDDVLLIVTSSGLKDISITT